MHWKAHRPSILVVALYDGIIRFLYAAMRGRGARRRGRARVRGEARARHHHSPAGAAAHGCGRTAGAGAQRVLRVDLSRRFCRRRSRLRRQKFEHAIDACAMCAMHGAQVAQDPSVNPAPLQVVMHAGAAASRSSTADECGRLQRSSQAGIACSDASNLPSC